MSRLRVYLFLTEPSSSVASRVFQRLYFYICLTSVISWILAKEYHLEHDILFDILFTFELLVRGLCFPNGFLNYIRQSWLVDIFSILPTYVSLLLGHDFVKDSKLESKYLNLALDAFLCFVPIGRFLKTSRSARNFLLLRRALKRSERALYVPTVFLVILILFFASTIYAVEFRLNPEKKVLSSFSSTLYFVIITVSTIGYGDYTPIHPIARFLTCCLILLGILNMAMPLAIIADSFNHVYDLREKYYIVDKVEQRMRALRLTSSEMQKEFFKVAQSRGIVVTTFQKLFQNLQLHIPNEEVIELFDHLDVNNDGILDWREFCKQMDWDKRSSRASNYSGV